MGRGDLLHQRFENTFSSRLPEERKKVYRLWIILKEWAVKAGKDGPLKVSEHEIQDLTMHLPLFLPI